MLDPELADLRCHISLSLAKPMVVKTQAGAPSVSPVPCSERACCDCAAAAVDEAIAEWGVNFRSGARYSAP